MSVVDYCLVSHETLPLFCDFEVIRTSELISRIDNVSAVAPTGIPDHSLLAWKIDLGSNFVNTSDVENLQSDQPFDKFDVSTVPVHILSSPDILRNVNNVISSLESSLRAQRDIDSAFNDWCHMSKQTCTIIYHTKLFLLVLAIRGVKLESFGMTYALPSGLGYAAMKNIANQ